MNLISIVLALSINCMIQLGVQNKVEVSENNSPPPTIFELLEPDYVVEEEKTIEVCSSSSSKTYMDYSKTSKTSRQGKFMAEHMTIKDGLLYDKDGYIGVALGSYFGEIGHRYIFILDTGIELMLIKVEEKSDYHTNNGCEQKWDHSVIEFVIDEKTHKFPYFSNKYIANGNFNNLPQFKGNIVKIIDKGGN